MKQKRKFIAWVLLLALIFTSIPSIPAKAVSESDVTINVLDYGADPTGATDSTVAIWNALEDAKQYEADDRNVTVEFPKGEYHIYKDKAQTREYHTSNTNSIENPVKTIGFLIEDHENLTIEGNESLFMMHGNMMALAVVRSKNVTLKDFAWDFAVPTVVEMTVTAVGSNYTDYYIPDCFPHAVSGNTIRWSSDLSPYTGQPYWSGAGHQPDGRGTYAVVGYHPDDEMARNYYPSDGPLSNVSSITEIDGNNVRVYYSSRSGAQSGNQKVGTIFELCGNAHRETAGAFTWESENVTADGVDVHFMHGFGWLIQMSKDVYYRNCNLVPRENSGHTTVSFADGIHASGAAGQLLFENCNFANTHDDPLNLHGTFTLVREQSGNQLTLRYEHGQQGGFPQYHVGDKVQFFTRDTLSSTDGEKQYTVAEVVQEATDSSDDRTMIIRFEETLPSELNNYVAENVTYAPAVTIKGCTFKNVATRGVLCTTRNEVIIEDNIFLNTSMATIFLSNDSNEWFESGPIRDMKIRNNIFYIKDIGRTAWNTAPAIYVHPVTQGGGLPDASNPIHKNITIDGNTFFMDLDRVVEAESVENLKFTNNKVYRLNPDVEINISLANASLAVDDKAALAVTKTGNTNNGSIDNLFQFTKCKNVLIEGNTYDDGLKLCAVADQATINNTLTVNDDEITIGSISASEAVRNIQYASTNPAVATVDANGNVTAVSEGETTIFAYYKWKDTIVRSNYVDVSVGDGAGTGDGGVPQEPVVTYELNPAFEIVRENDNHSYDADSIEITAEGDSDLWQWDNDLKNLFLYTPDVERSNLRTSVKVDNLPVRENNKWDTASFILYKGDDDYYTIGKKSHFDGFATVKERLQTATEAGEGTTTNNAVSSAWLGMTKVGETITLDYSLDGETWTTVGSFTDDTFGNDYRIGFGAWGTTRKVTFSEFKVGTADQTYADLEAVEIMTAVGATTPEEPEVSDVFVKFGTEVVYEENGAEEVAVSLPEEVSQIEMSYAFEEEVAISKNGTALEDVYENTDNVLFDVEDGDVIVITCGGKTYTFTIKMVPSNITTVEKIKVAAINNFEVTPADEKAFFPGETVQKKGTIEVTVEENVGDVKVLYGNLREDLNVEKNGNVYVADYTLVDGLNSFYIQSVAKDGITTKQYIVNVVYDAPTQPTLTLSNTKVQNLKAGVTVGDLAVAGVEDAEGYAYELCEGSNDTHNEYFKIVDGQLKLRKALTDGQTYFVRVKATNGEEALEAVFAIVAEKASVEYPREDLEAISDNEYPAEPNDNILDGNYDTKWHTDWTGGTTYINQESKRWIGVKLPEATEVTGIRYLPTQGTINANDGTGNGRIEEYRAEYSTEASGDDNWIEIKTGTFDTADTNWQTVKFDIPVTALRVRLVGVKTLMPGGTANAHMTCAEFRVTVPETEDPDVPTTPVTDIFDDVTASDWFADEVQYVYDRGIMTGVSATTFEPETAVTRATIVQTLYKLEGKPAVSDFTKYDSLNDTLDSIWWRNSLAWALNEGVAKGDSKNHVFNPDNEVTREDLATFIYRYAQYKGVNVELERTVEEILGDTYVNSWAQTAFAWAIDTGLIKGKTINGISDLAPQVGATRAELATIMMRFYQNNNL